MAFNVYKMRLLPNAKDPDANPFDFCRREGVVGVGHDIYRDRSYESLEEVEEALWDYEGEHYSSRSRFNQDDSLSSELRYILKEIEAGDYIWVNRGNTFGLCRVTGGWEVLPNLPEDEQSEYDRNDIQNFRDVEWRVIPYSAVPGFVRRQFSGQFGTLARMRDPINETTRALIERLFEAEDLERRDAFAFEDIREYLETTPADEILNLLGPIETEDIVLLYLQSKGWRLVASSLSTNQSEIECELVRGGEVAYVQVKSGNASVDPGDYKDYDGTVFLFVGDDVEPRENIQRVGEDNVVNYLRQNTEEAPRGILSAIQSVATA